MNEQTERWLMGERWWPFGTHPSAQNLEYDGQSGNGEPERERRRWARVYHGRHRKP
jgi:hypothetical protein